MGLARPFQPWAIGLQFDWLDFYGFDLSRFGSFDLRRPRSFGLEGIGRAATDLASRYGREG